MGLTYEERVALAAAKHKKKLDEQWASVDALLQLFTANAEMNKSASTKDTISARTPALYMEEDGDVSMAGSDERSEGEILATPDSQHKPVEMRKRKATETPSIRPAPSARSVAPSDVNADRPAATAEISLQNKAPTASMSRPSVPSAFLDDRRSAASTNKSSSDFSKGPKFRPLTVNPYDKPTAQPDKVVERFTETVFVENWQVPKTSNNPEGRRLRIELLKIKDTIMVALKTVTQRNTEKYDTELDSIRQHLHTLEYLEGLNKTIVQSSNILAAPKQSSEEPQVYLASSPSLAWLFLNREDGFKFPADVVADAKGLHRKWTGGDFDPDIMRGIKWSTSSGANAEDPNYGSRKKATYYGAGDLVSGQWWPVTLAAKRDGAIISHEAGISGPPPNEKKSGATSILVAGQYPEDEDHGDVILYCGTMGSKGEAKQDTMHLLNSAISGKPVRVIRSFKLVGKSKYAPKLGYRYDGVYKVMPNPELLNQEKAHYRFRLVREDGQDPIRWQGIGARPTAWDIAAYEKHKGLKGRGGSGI